MSDKVAVVSGGSRGLGASLAKDLSARGWRVATFSRSESAAVQEMRASDREGARYHWAQLDGSDRKSVGQFVRDVASRFGRVDAVINSAGVAPEGMLTLMSAKDIDATLSLNLGGSIYLTQACVKVMLAKGQGGSVVNISSVNGVKGHSGVSVYGATKAALDGFTRGLARELGSRNIRVNSVAPGYFESEMVGGLSPEARSRIERRTPLGRLGRIEDIVSVVRFLLSEDAGFISGQTIVVDGGLTC